MKLAACFLTLLPGFAVAASWTSPGFPAFSEQGTGTFVSHAQLPKGTRPLTLNFDQQYASGGNISPARGAYPTTNGGNKCPRKSCWLDDAPGR